MITGMVWFADSTVWSTAARNPISVRTGTGVHTIQCTGTWFDSDADVYITRRHHELPGW